MNLDLASLRQSWPLPTRPRPIVLIGAGGIVNDAHLPAYRKSGLPVAGIFDVDGTRARATAEKFGLPRIYETLGQALAQDAVFDIAVPPEFEYDVVAAIAPGSTVLLQKPMGVDLADARRIRDVCRAHQLVAAVNFQLRFAPMMLIVRDAIDRGLLGPGPAPITDLEFHLNLRTPWELFPFLKKLKRCEILVHTVHHLDMCRALLGDPAGVYAQTLPHPAFPELASTRTAAILNYGPATRCVLSINHNFEFGPRHESADVTIQGHNGAIRVSLGLLLNYPNGLPETVEITTRDLPWTAVPVKGRWFPDGFVGTMSNLQRFAAGEDDRLISHYEDAYRTMALVEACYASSASGGTPLAE
jgi:predicted dehydrogenase